MVGWLSFLHRGRNILCNVNIVVKGYYKYFEHTIQTTNSYTGLLIFYVQINFLLGILFFVA